MEDTLREKFGSKIQKPIKVLILVLMEDTLREKQNTHQWKPQHVLILVLMEDTLRVYNTLAKVTVSSLNPCFNGIYSQIFSVTGYICKVLILVLMEDTLRGLRKGIVSFVYRVLILVLMEDTLRGYRLHLQRRRRCLNPCFNGRYSQSHRSLRYYHQTFRS